MKRTERLRLKYTFIQTTCCLAIIAGISVAGVISMARGNDKGLTVVTSVLNLLVGYLLGLKRASR